MYRDLSDEASIARQGRNQIIKELHDAGMTEHSVAKNLSVSVQGVKVIITGNRDGRSST